MSSDEKKKQALIKEQAEHQRAFLWNRRQMLKATGVGSLTPLAMTPLGTLLNGLVDGLISQAQAEEAQAAAPISVNIWHGGGREAAYNHSLAPTPGSAFMENGSLGTGFRGGVFGYHLNNVTVLGRNLNLTPVQTAGVMRPDGSNVSNLDLSLDGHLIMNYLTNDSHELATTFSDRPDSTEASLGGLVADQASSPLSAVSLFGGNSSQFASDTGVGLIQTNSGDVSAINQLLDPFRSELNASQSSRRQLLENARNNAMAKLAAFVATGHPGSSRLAKNRSGAELFIKDVVARFAATGSNSIASQYGALLTKYQNIIRNCFANVNRVFPEAIPSEGMKSLSGQQSRLNPADNNSPMYRQRITASDLRTCIDPTSTSCGVLAHNMAVAEYLLTNKMSNVVYLGAGETANFLMTSYDLVDESGNVMASRTNGRTGYYYDGHSTGAYVHLVMASMHAFALQSCIYELKLSLAANGLWDIARPAAITHFSEFSRAFRATNRTPGAGEAPNLDNFAGSGADHHGAGSCITIISPQIEGFQDAMHVKLDTDPGGRYRGTQGTVAPVPNYNGGGASGAVVGIGGALSTVASVLGLKKAPTKANNPSVLTKQANGKFTLGIPRSRVKV